jgi:nitrite reductase/ring-hydroxylating ferredoxin subunit
VLVDVAAAVDLTHGVPRLCTVQAREVVVVRWGDAVYALRNICPHQSLPLDGGTVQPSVRSPAPMAEIDVVVDEPLITCPMHAWAFDLRTGRCLVDPKLRVKTYPVSVENGRVLVEADASPQTGEDE